MSTNHYCILILLSMIWQVCGLRSNVCKKLSERKRVMCEKFYVWDNEQQVFVSMINETLKPLTQDDYDNFKYKTIRLVVNNMLPYVVLDRSTGNLGGYLGDVWNIILDKYKFNYVVAQADYDSALEMISSGQADVMLGAVVYKENLLNVYYSHPYFYNWYHLYMRAPMGKPSSSLYLKTFNMQLWASSCLIFAILTGSVWLTSRFLSVAYHAERSISLLSCFLGIVSGFINQGFDLKLQSYSGRFQVMLALVFGVMLYFAMNAALVAKIAVFEAPYPFASLPDIARRTGLSLCLRTGSFVYNNFTTERREVLPAWRGILNNENCLDINDAANIPKIICKDNVIVFENKVIMSSLSKIINFPCTIDYFNAKYFTTGNSYLMLRALKEKKIIDSYVMLMRSVGVLQRLEAKWIENNILTENGKDSTAQVTMGHTQGVFVFYIVAMSLSLVLLALEILYNKYFSNDPILVSYYN